MSINRIILTLIAFAFVNGNTSAQQLLRVDSIVKQYPAKYSQVNFLADRINSDFHSNMDKSRAVYTWIALNIRYDIKKYKRSKKKNSLYNKLRRKKWKNEYKYEKRLAQKTLNKGKGICGDYSILYKRICDLLRIDCRVISGHAKSSPKYIGTKYGEKHAWNMVHLNGEWHPIDVTWGAGIIDFEREIYTPSFNSFWFLTSPQKFSYKHYPKNKEWLLTDCSREDFASYPYYSSYYLASGFDILKPKSGVIEVEKNNMLSFSIKNMAKSDAIDFRFKSQDKINSVTPEFDGDCWNFEIPHGKRSRDYLYLFIEYRHVATYKVIIK